MADMSILEFGVYALVCYAGIVMLIISSFKETFLIPWLIWTAKILCIGLSWDAKWIKHIESFPPETATKIRLLNERKGEISFLKFENVRGLSIANILYLNWKQLPLQTSQKTLYKNEHKVLLLRLVLELGL